MESGRPGLANMANNVDLAVHFFFQSTYKVDDFGPP